MIRAKPIWYARPQSSRLDTACRSAFGAGRSHGLWPRLRLCHLCALAPFPGTAAASAAWVVDVAVDTETGEVTLTRIFIGQDQGLVINPDGVRQQIHGNAIQTASRIMVEDVSFSEIAPTAQSWAAYPIQTFSGRARYPDHADCPAEDPPLGSEKALQSPVPRQSPMRFLTQRRAARPRCRLRRKRCVRPLLHTATPPEGLTGCIIGRNA